MIDSLPKFTARLYLHPHNLPIRMDIQRGAKTVEVSVLPADFPAGVESLADLIDPQNSLVTPLGVFVLGLDQAQQVNLPELRSSTGVIVVGKVDYAPTIETDLAVGDVIQSVNGAPVGTVNELRLNCCGSSQVMQWWYESKVKGCIDSWPLKWNERYEW